MAGGEARLYSGRYLNAIYQHMQSDALETEQAEELFERYTALDAFDERIYMALMGIYQKKELFHKGVQLYQKLQQLLEEEFGIAPSKAASDLYHVLLNTGWTPRQNQKLYRSRPQSQLYRMLHRKCSAAIC